MKKTVALVLLFVCSFLFLKAQLPYIHFPTDSAQWSVWHTTNTPSFSQTSIQYKMKGDTIINSLTYHKIYSSTDLYYGSNNQTLHCFLREDTTKKVFVKYPVGGNIDTSEFMLYNFNLSIGDTVTIKLLYHISTDSLFKFVVTNIDSNLFVGGYRRHFLMGGVSPTWGLSCDVLSWVEGIGDSYNLFYDEIHEQICTNQEGYNLECFWDRGTYIFGGTFCDYTTVGVNEIITVNSYPKVLPNPVSDISTLEFKQEYKLFEVYNTLGEKLVNEDVSGKIKISLLKRDFLSGNYILKITDRNGNYQIGKFTVQ